MTTQVYLRVFSLQGLGADYMRRFPKGKVSIGAELGNTQASTVQVDFGAGSVKMDHVSTGNRLALIIVIALPEGQFLIDNRTATPGQ
jgi:hypothetical protein